MEGMTPVQEKHLMTCHHETRQVSDDSSVALRLGRLGLAMGHALNSSKAPEKRMAVCKRRTRQPCIHRPGARETS